MASAAGSKSAIDVMFKQDDMDETIDGRTTDQTVAETINGHSGGFKLIKLEGDSTAATAAASTAAQDDSDTTNTGGAGAGAGAGANESDSKDDPTDDSSKKEEESKTIPKPKLERGLTGLRNQGNTCFMNTFIQCINSTPYLVQFFLAGLHIPIIKDNLKKKAAKEGKELTEEELTELMEQSVAYRTGKLIYGMWEKNRRVRPTQFRKHLMKHRSSMNNYRQHDTEEALTLFLDCCHEELKTSQVIQFPSPPQEVIAVRDALVQYSTAIEAAETDEQKTALKEEYNKIRDANVDLFTILDSYEKWNSIFKDDYSIMTDVFTGMTVSTIECQSCHYKSNTFEQCTRLSVGLDDSKTTESIHDCIKRYFQTEVIPKAEDSWKCSSCKERVEIHKGMKMWELPCMLIVQLKRFEYLGKTRKIKSKIDFPLEGLDISDAVSNVNLFYKNDIPKYNLYAVANHSGGADGGHYYAYCKNMLNGCWYEMNDTHVIRMKKSDVVTSNAYILFFVREDKDKTVSMGE